MGLLDPVHQILNTEILHITYYAIELQANDQASLRLAP